MRLLTHNMITCNVKACIATANRSMDEGPINFPLQIKPSMDGLSIQSTVFSKDFLVHILDSIDWKALVKTVNQLNRPDLPNLPDSLSPNYIEDLDLLKSIHRVILDTSVNEGELICQNCLRSYPIENGIPSMILEEDEL